MQIKPSILTFSGYYLPGYKGGGPIRSINNLVSHLSKEYQFKIVTSDRDLGDNKPYPNVIVGSWQQVEDAEVYYLPANQYSIAKLAKLICSIEHDVIYINSFFSLRFSIKILLLRKLGLISRKPIVLAPRGEFSLGALEIKKLKKVVYIYLARKIGLYNNLTWQASSVHEVEDIQRWFGKNIKININVNIAIAPDMPNIRDNEIKYEAKEIKIAGELNIIFLSRISKKKNLLGALQMLKGLEGKVSFSIYGPIEDIKYWEECEIYISTLPPNITVEYKGSIGHDQVLEVMSKYHLFLFPTFGENYGHVIIESLISGCPVLISDQTPWNGLEEKGLGWDIPLSQFETFQTTIQKCIDMDQEKFMIISELARKYGYEQSTNQSVLEQNRLLFSNVL